MLDTITEGTRRVLDFAKASTVQNFLFVSSGAVYGKQPADCLNVPESYIGTTDPLLTTSAYAVGKLYAEHICGLYAKQYDLPVKIARCFAFVGPHLPLTTHFAIGNFIANALSGESINILGDGSPRRSYLYAADLAVWLWTLLCFGKAGSAYNVGSEEGVSIAELAALVSEQVTPSLPMTIAKKRNEHEAIERYVPCTKRAREELKLQAWVSLPDAIQRTIKWNHSNAKVK
jgi:dTDP-glucose 4,6-dehydratase